MKQDQHHTLDEFLQILKTLSRQCNYTNVTSEEYRSESIRDAFISGLYSNHIRQRLLENHAMSLEEAFNQARSLDLAQKQSLSYNTGESYPASVSTMNSTVPENSIENRLSVTVKQKCYFCGKPRHSRTVCPARDATCNKCGKKGHFAKVCKSTLASEASASITSYFPTLATTVTNFNPHVVTEVNINDIPTKALVDTGATDSFLDSAFVQRHNLHVYPADHTVGMASGSVFSKVLGQCFVTVTIQNQKYEHCKMSILKALVADVIIGGDFMKMYSSVIFEFGGEQPSLVLSTLQPMLMKSPPLFSSLESNSKPVAIKSRRYSTPDRNFIKLEVSRLQSEGIIEKSSSPWRAQVVVCRSDNRKPRLVIDYSQTINRYTKSDAYPLPRVEEIITAVAKHKVYSTLDLRAAYHQVILCESDKPYTAFEADGQLWQFTRVPFGLTNAVAIFQRLMDNFVKDNDLDGVYIYIDNITIGGTTQEEHDRNLSKFLRAAEDQNLTFNHGKSIINTDTIQLLGYEISKGSIKPDPSRVRPLLDIPITSKYIST